MAFSALVQRTANVPDDLYIIGDWVDVTDMYKFSLALQGNPDDEVLIYGSKNPQTVAERTYPLGTLQSGNILDIPPDVSVGAIAAYRVAGTSVGAKVNLCGLTLGADTPSSPAPSKSLLDSSTDLPDNSGDVTAWVPLPSIPDGTASQPLPNTYRFYARSFQPNDAAEIEVALFGDGGANPYVPAATVGFFDNSREFVEIPANFVAFRVRRTNGIPNPSAPNKANISGTGTFYGPQAMPVTDQPIPPIPSGIAAFSAFAIINYDGVNPPSVGGIAGWAGMNRLAAGQFNFTSPPQPFLATLRNFQGGPTPPAGATIVIGDGTPGNPHILIRNAAGVAIDAGFFAGSIF